jgi:cellulose synthase/poly-beta-1,6-N-acetylglucosamine synthase-like glycosyltransferase
MLEVVQVIWFMCLLVLGLYHLFVFRLKNKTDSHASSSNLPGVSVIIAVRNGPSEFKEHIYSILQQDYPTFELIVVDDHSEPAKRKELEVFISTLSNTNLILSDGRGKKQALMTGIEKAKYDFVLFTDADCSPSGKFWIKTMMEQNTYHGTVLGYSPYLKLGGWLNLLVRFETLMTGMQYLSWAMKGRPYMAVGRNVLYPRELLIKRNPFQTHSDIPYGDDDLAIQSLARQAQISICIDRRAQMMSKAPASFGEWLKQKHRHLSAGHYYKAQSWWQPGLYGIALIGNWFLIPFMIHSLEVWHWLPLLIAFLLLRWMNYKAWSDRLGDTDTIKWYPLLEIFYTMYLAFMGAFTLMAKKKTWN